MPDELNSPPDGIIDGYHGHSLTIRILMIVFSSIALYNAIELFILLFLTFQHYRGLYFWSLLLSVVLGVIPHIRLAIFCRILRFVLWLIIVDAFILLIPTTILTFSTAYVQTLPFIRGYNVVERLQLAWFCLQEFVISGIYIHETVKLLKLMPNKDQRRSRIMYELLAINFVIILMDVALLVVEYIGYYSLQTTLKPMVYSIKLKLEFGVLGKLVSLVQTNRSQPTSTEHEEYPGFVDPSQLTSDVTHAMPAESRVPRGMSAWNNISLESLPMSERRMRPSTNSTDNSQPP
ncbi:hypothetical protein N7448_009966 [Penicillium atrosanguineum]|nr:hypothetical protein N7448_009966 [Penicillium atrosanguineum]